jgi:ferredoxin
MKRRNALQTFAAGAAILAAGAAPYGFASVLAPRQATAQRNYLRPPGAIENDRAFTAACIGCGLCGEVCPPRCIRFHTRNGGDGGGVNTPYIDPEESACILCNKCMEVCPTEALTVVPRDSICGACVSICPLGEKAISFKMWKQYRPVIQQGCVGCGLCVEVCPHPSKPIWIVERGPETNEEAA